MDQEYSLIRKQGEGEGKRERKKKNLQQKRYRERGEEKEKTNNILAVKSKDAICDFKLLDWT